MKLLKIQLLLIFLTSFISFSQTAKKPRGSGSKTDPYLIENLENLHWISVTNIEKANDSPRSSFTNNFF